MKCKERNGVADVSPEIVDKVKSFAKSVAEEIQVQKVYLFGSYASGTANNDSDIDVLIISNDFIKMSPIDIGFLLFRKAAKIPGDLQPVGYTYEEFLKNNNLFLREILDNSLEIPLQ
jgi:predicted nucleotidyltransferase